MRSINHLNGRYASARLREMLDQRRHPDHPWLTREAVGLLDRLLKPTDVGVEFGSGRSSLWFAARMARLTSIEHNEPWFEKVRGMLAAQPNAEVRLLSAEGDDPAATPYVKVLDTFANGSLDFVLVDGSLRGHCAQAALPKLKSGGLLTIDNVNWYLPNTSRAPNSRRKESGPLDATWHDVEMQLAPWRRIWTSNGVSDTAIFFKP